MARGDKKDKGSGAQELVSLVRTGAETQLESSRRRKIPLPNNPNTLKRYGVAAALLIVALFVLFKAETSSVPKEDEASIAPPGQKGAWTAGGDQLDDIKKKRAEEDAKKMAESLETDNEGAAKTSDETANTEDETANTEDETTATETPATDPGPAVALRDMSTKANDEAKIAALKTGRRPMIKYQYKPRSKFADDATEKAALAKTWGKWEFVDAKAADRPKDDFAGGFSNRDIPWDKFPANAWQTDQEYLSKFLPQAKAHVERAMEAMMAEYGMSKFDLPDKDFEARMEESSFHTEWLNITGGDNIKVGRGFVGEQKGGWVTQRYFDGLIRRLMHSLITQDTFTLVMGGHSAAAGHGNHFQQSYTLQFHKVLEPVFARLGLKLSSHNIAYGGLGTVQTSLAAGDLYGKEIDILVWDSGMTEKSNEAYDLYVRQAYLSGNRIPVLLGGMGDAMVKLHDTIDAEVGMFGGGIGGVAEVKNVKEADAQIWAARCVRSSGEVHDYCRTIEYNGTCWIDRDDYTPREQKAAPGGRASWHPGFRHHALKGRIIGFMVLRALKEGLTMWEEAPDKKLPEGVWHVKDHYENIRKKLSEVKEEDAFCFAYKELEPKSICTVPLNGVSDMTPRINPKENSIRNIMKPAADGYIPVPEESVYNPPDVFNPTMETPDGAFDYLAVVENGIEYNEIATFDNAPITQGAQKTNNKLIPLGVKDIAPGIGWSADSNTNPDECDGSYDGFCGRGPKNECLLYGHNDHRGGLMFDSYSGWGVFTIPNVKKGLIFTRIEWWHANINPRTDGWTTENNATAPTRRRLSKAKKAQEASLLESPNSKHWSTDFAEDMWTDRVSNSTQTQKKHRLGDPLLPQGRTERHLKGQEICEKAKFEIAVNGKVTSFTKKEYRENLKAFQRVVPILTILDDEGVTKGEPHDVEIAIRLTGCDKNNVFKLSHIYWA